MQHARQLFERAAAEHWAIGAFNASGEITLKAIFRAAQHLEAPVIIESSPGETDYFGAKAFRAVVDAYQEQYGATVLLNLDHSVDETAAKIGIDTGYDLIHFDGGTLDYTSNVRKTSKIVREAHRHHLMVEGELDHITGSSDDHRTKSVAAAQKDGTYTDPERAADFVCATGIDTLAVFIGNVHGLYKEPPTLDLDRLTTIHETVDAFLSLHGGSGIRDADIKAAIARGITKINVNTELRLTYLEALQQVVTKPKELAAYKFLPPVTDALQQVIESKIKLFGSAGKTKRRWVKRSL